MRAIRKNFPKIIYTRKNLGKDTPRGGSSKCERFLNLKPVFFKILPKMGKKEKNWPKNADFAWFHAKSRITKKHVQFWISWQKCRFTHKCAWFWKIFLTLIRKTFLEKIRRGVIRTNVSFFEFKACFCRIFKNKEIPQKVDFLYNYKENHFLPNNGQKHFLTKKPSLKELNLYFNIMNVKLFLVNPKKPKKWLFVCFVRNLYVNWFILVIFKLTKINQNKQKTKKNAFHAQP